MALATLGLLLAAVPACDSTHKQDMRLIPAQSTFEADIPIPAGFKLVENACEDQLTGARRLYLRHLYEGDADKYAVRKFYREQMPRAQWALASDGNVKGEYTLRFEKGTESCTVRVTDGKGGAVQRTLIQILILQEERGQSIARDNP